MPGAPFSGQVDNKSAGNSSGDDLTFARVLIEVSADEIRDVRELRLPNQGGADEAGVVQAVNGTTGGTRNTIQAGDDVVFSSVADGDGNLDPAARLVEVEGGLVGVVDGKIDQREVGSDEEGSTPSESSTRELGDARLLGESGLAPGCLGSGDDHVQGLFINFGFLGSKDVEWVVQNVIEAGLEAGNVPGDDGGGLWHFRGLGTSGTSRALGPVGVRAAVFALANE